MKLALFLAPISSVIAGCGAHPPNVEAGPQPAPGAGGKAARSPRSVAGATALASNPDAPEGLARYTATIWGQTTLIQIGISTVRQYSGCRG